MSDPEAHDDRREAPLAMDPEAFRRVGHALVDRLATFLGELRERPVTRDEPPSELRRLLPPDAMPETGRDAAALFDEVVPLLVEHSLLNGHPRFLGYVTSSAAPIGALADLLAASINANCGGWQLSPIASEIEGQCVRWIADLLGCERPWGGLLVSGGNMANLTAFLAARRAKADPAVRERGVGASPGTLTAYVSAATHTWVHKAADLFGHGSASVRWIPTDGRERIDLAELERRIRADRAGGLRPFLIVGNAGTVSTGAVDPLPAMRELADRYDLWFHVDGAYGAFAVVDPTAPAELAAMRDADSIAVDPHKWLYAPLEAGCTLVRDPAILPATFGYTPAYYRFTGEDEERVNYYEWGMQNSRGFRALKVWLALRQAGREGYRRMIADDIRLAREIDALIDRTPELERGPGSLSIATFRHVPSDLDPVEDAEYLNRLNEEALATIKREGRCFLSNAVVDGRFLLRACIVNFRTDRGDVEALPGLVLDAARRTDRELRPR